MVQLSDTISFINGVNIKSLSHYFEVGMFHHKMVQQDAPTVQSQYNWKNYSVHTIKLQEFDTGNQQPQNSRQATEPFRVSTY